LLLKDVEFRLPPLPTPVDSQQESSYFKKSLWWSSFSLSIVKIALTYSGLQRVFILKGISELGILFVDVFIIFMSI